MTLLSECGNSAIRNNSVIHSFMDTKRLRLSKEKSVVVHIGPAKKCTLPCPPLKVHNEFMDIRISTKYLRNIISSKGGAGETIEERRKIGWGKISTIMGIFTLHHHRPTPVGVGPGEPGGTLVGSRSRPKQIIQAVSSNMGLGCGIRCSVLML